MSRSRRERGAAAVEMALVLPILLLVIGGLVDLGRALYLNTVVSAGAREGARMVAMGYSTAAATTRVNQAAVLPGSLTRTTTFTTCPSASDTATATVTVNNFSWMVLNVVPSFFGGSVPVPTISATGSMRCLG